MDNKSIGIRSLDIQTGLYKYNDSILDLKIHPETECECSWGRIGSHVNTRVNVNAAVREGSTGRIHPLVPGYCKKVLTAESKPQISESRCLFGESV